MRLVELLRSGRSPTQVLRHLPIPHDRRVLVGCDTVDDAGVYQLRDDLLLIQTVDFFTPIVDDPYTYGAIAAANALSDVYAMGGHPLLAMNIVCYAMRELGPGPLQAILQGGYDKVVEAGASIVGGHSIEIGSRNMG